jgi:hypothetical protein
VSNTTEEDSASAYDGSMTGTVTCPLDGETLTLDVTEQRQDGFCFYVVVTEKGSIHAHMRDAHPRWWSEQCELQRAMNANPYVTFMPRKVNGCLLLPGEDVGDL